MSIKRPHNITLKKYLRSLEGIVSIIISKLVQEIEMARHATYIGIRGTLSLSNLEIRCLNIIWKLGIKTVKRVYEAILTADMKQNSELLIPYTTIMSVMNEMSNRGILKRDKSQRTHYFEPAFNREEIKAMMIKAINKALK